MKKNFQMSLILKVLVVGLALTLAWSGQVRAADELSLQLQKGLLAEEVHRDYATALKAYQAAVAVYDTNRQAAATAVFRLGETYRKLGRTNEARAQYERVLFEFADQSALAGAAMKQMQADFGRAAVPASVTTTSPGDDAQRKLLLSELRMREAQLASLKKLKAESLPMALMQWQYNDQLNSLLKSGDELRLQRAVKLKDLSPEHPEIVRSDAALKENDRMIAELVGIIMGQMEERVRLLGEQVNGTTVANTTRSIPTRPLRVSAGTVEPAIPVEEQVEIERLRAMLKNSPDLINAKVEGQQIPLHKAAGLGQTAVAEFLVKNGADINKKSDGMVWTPLLAAAYNGHKGMVELLLKQGADKEAMDTQKVTPLIAAASKGYRAVVGELIEAGANVNAQDGGGYTALHYAAMAGDHEMARQLLKAKADPGLKLGDKTWAGRSGDKATALHLAARTNSLVLIDALLAAGADVKARDAIGQTPLFGAFSQGNVEILKRLIEAKADVAARNIDGSSVLHYIGKYTTPELVREVVKAGADVNGKGREGWTPLAAAVGAGKLEVVELLLKNGAEPNVMSQHAMTPLMLAISAKNADMVRLLLTNGAKAVRLPEAPVWQHPVVAAAKHDEIEIMQVLLDRGVDLSVTNDKGYTSLHYAVATMNGPMVELLVKHKADPNAVHPGSGETPMTLAQAGRIVDLDNPNKTAGRPTSPNVPSAIRSSTQPFGGRLSESEIKAGFEQIVKLLVEHGGDEFFRRRAVIAVGRNLETAEPIFRKDAAGINRYSLYELLATQYSSPFNRLVFPDFTRITISRLEGSGVKNRTVNIASALESGDCAGDLWLEWGDIVEIPEADHNLTEPWGGLPASLRNTLVTCNQRKVVLTVKGNTYGLTLKPMLHFLVPPGVPLMPGTVPPGAAIPPMRTVVYTNLGSMRLSSVVFDSKALLASSDPKRVKVTRAVSKSGEKKEMLYNVGEIQNTPNDLWLRDGDVIEVPEKE